ncbi:MAG: cytochrome b N-terminal domain-containing protein [Acidimicrobiales bacterium]
MTVVARVHRWLLRAVLFLSVVLVATGLWLIVGYRPSSDEAWNDIWLLSSDQWPRRAHRLAGALLTYAAGFLMLLSLVLGIGGRRWGRTAGAVGIAVLAVVGGFTGFLLPWDQLALWAVTVGTNMRGMWPAAFGDSVRFVILGGTEVSQATFRNWFLVHSVLLPVLAIGGAFLARRYPSRDKPTAPGT